MVHQGHESDAKVSPHIKTPWQQLSLTSTPLPLQRSIHNNLATATHRGERQFPALAMTAHGRVLNRLEEEEEEQKGAGGRDFSRPQINPTTPAQEAEHSKWLPVALCDNGAVKPTWWNNSLLIPGEAV